MADAVKVGDRVTWKSGKNPHALAITGCLVLALGETDDGRPAATVRLERFDTEANALVADLTVEPAPQSQSTEDDEPTSLTTGA
jgi:hypothetical protein